MTSTLAPKAYAYWAWQGDNGIYRPFGKSESMALEKHFKAWKNAPAAHSPRMQLAIAGQPYEFSVEDLTQVNTLSNRVRKIVRVAGTNSHADADAAPNVATATTSFAPPSSAAAPSNLRVTWRWKGFTSPAYFDCPEALSAQIEKAFSKDLTSTTANIMPDGSSAHISFTTMTFSSAHTAGEVIRIEKRAHATPAASAAGHTGGGSGDVSAGLTVTSAFTTTSSMAMMDATIPARTVAMAAPHVVGTVSHAEGVHRKRARSPETAASEGSGHQPTAPPMAHMTHASVAATHAPSSAVAFAGGTDATTSFPPSLSAASSSPHVMHREQWQKHGTLLFLDAFDPASPHAAARPIDLTTNRVRIAAFDMDDTIVKSKSGKVFAQGSDDWQFVHPNVATQLVKLWREERAMVVIFSNQSGIGKGRWDEGKATDIRAKIIKIANTLGIPLSAWVSTTEDSFRKPQLGMWEHFVGRLGGAQVDKGFSFYCGDAAGRYGPTLAGRAKDFSCSDRKFAYNIKLAFKTPELYFAGQSGVPAAYALPINWEGPSPESLKSLPTTYPYPHYHRLAAGAECVLFVGYPGSGKSTFYRRFFQKYGYTHINRDTLKDTARCVTATAAALDRGESVVVDNTSPSADDRKKFITVAKHRNIPVRVILFTTSREMAEHMNKVRDVCGISKRIPSIAYNMYETKFQRPKSAEESGGEWGVDSIVEVPFVADFDGLPPSVKDNFFLMW